MTEFNLLPSDHRRKKAKIMAPLSVVVTLGVIAVALIGMEGFLSYKAVGISYAQLGNFQLQKQKELKLAKRDTEEIRHKFKPYLNLISKHYPWSNVLIGIAQAARGQVWLRQVSAATEDDLCTLNGQAHTTEAVFRFMEALKRLEFFNMVRINSISKNTSKEKRTVTFEIACQFNKESF